MNGYFWASISIFLIGIAAMVLIIVSEKKREEKQDKQLRQILKELRDEDDFNEYR